MIVHFTLIYSYSLSMHLTNDFKRILMVPCFILVAWGPALVTVPMPALAVVAVAVLALHAPVAVPLTISWFFLCLLFAVKLALLTAAVVTLTVTAFYHTVIFLPVVRAEGVLHGVPLLQAVVIPLCVLYCYNCAAKHNQQAHANKKHDLLWIF